MKMEAPVTATVGGTVLDIVVTPGDQVGPGQVLVVVQPGAVAAAA
jgi:urea carboxylase